MVGKLTQLTGFILVSICFAQYLPEDSTSPGLLDRLMSKPDSIVQVDTIKKTETALSPASQAQTTAPVSPLHSKYAVSCELITYPDILNDFYYLFSNTLSTTVPSIGIRGYINPRTAIGFNVWMYYESAVKENVSLYQDEVPQNKRYSFTGTLLTEIYQGAKSYLAIYLQASIFYNTQHAGYTKVVSTSTYVYSNHYLEYKTIAASYTIGLEPAYVIDSHFSLFSQFGVGISFLPNHKFADTNDPLYSEYDPYSVPELKERPDKKTLFGINNYSIGVRYFF